jgi:iron complex outermembrane recepter protein
MTRSIAIPVKGFNVNLPPTKRSGMELEGQWTLTTSALQFANYTYSNAKCRSATLGGVDVSGNRIPLVPHHMAEVGIAWSIWERTRLNATANYVGHQLYDGDELNTFGREMPAYWTADVGVFQTIDQ